MLKYKFKEVHNCAMCGNDTSEHKRLGQRLNQSQGTRPKNKIGITVSVNKCNNCGLIYSSPQPIPFSIQDHYKIPPEDYWIPEYFKLDLQYFSEQIKVVKSFLPHCIQMKALDIGCGLGKCMLSLENSGFSAYGIEPSETFYEKAISTIGIKEEKIQLSTIENAKFPSNFFDFVTFGAVFEHLYDPNIALRNAIKWLKPGGVVHIEVPSSNDLNSKLINLYYRLICTNYVTNLSPMHSPFHLFEFSIESFNKLGKKLGFEVVESRYDVGSIYHIPKVFHSLIRSFMKITNTGNVLTVYIKKI
jgi:SAM-dependent methyltransferase